MSLSRYYKSSNSFQPEDIVKHDGGKKAAWSPLPRSDDQLFSSRPLIESKLPAGSTTKTAPQPSTVNDPPQSSAAPGDASSRDVSADDRLPLAETIDLSKFVEVTVAEQQREEAYRRGIEEGCEEERKRAEEDFAAAGRALLLACQQLDTLRETIIANSNRELVEFTLAIAEKIIRTSVQEQDVSIVVTIEEALRRAVKSDEFSIFLHPDDYAAVSAKAAEIVAGISGLNNIVLRKDRTIERGGAKIESDNCTIDATVAGQFDLIRAEVRKKL